MSIYQEEAIRTMVRKHEETEIKYQFLLKDYQILISASRRLSTSFLILTACFLILTCKVILF